VAAGEAAVSGIVDPAETSPSGAALTGEYGPPWEDLKPPAHLGYGSAWEHLEPAESDSWRSLFTDLAADLGTSRGRLLERQQETRRRSRRVSRYSLLPLQPHS
jgi:hypothetical protein